MENLDSLTCSVSVTFLPCGALGFVTAAADVDVAEVLMPLWNCVQFLLDLPELWLVETCSFAEVESTDAVAQDPYPAAAIQMLGIRKSFGFGVKSTVVLAQYCFLSEAK